MARQRRQGIDRFNIAVDINDSKKFIRFKRALGLTEGLSFLHLTRFIQFVAINHAFDPVVNPDDSEIIADFCFYQGPGETLLKALKTAGFIDEDWSVHEWFTHQPLAEKVQKKHEHCSEMGKKSAERRWGAKVTTVTDSGPPVTKNVTTVTKSDAEAVTNPKPLTPNSELQKVTTGVVTGERRGEPPPTPVQAKPFDSSNGHNPFAQTAETIAMFLEEVSELVTLNENDQAGIACDVKNFLKAEPPPDDWQNLRHWITEQLRIAKREGRLNVEEHGIKNPVAWIRKQIKSELSPLTT